jgi:hypothetical protein
LLGLFTLNAAALRSHVMFMQSFEPLPGDLTQPRVEGDGAFLEILWKFLRGFDQRFLDNI